MNYEAVIGLEVHIQLKTRTKMFTRAPAGYGHEPNTLTDPVVLALPGALPVLNKTAIDQVIRAGLLVHCRIADECRWDRKNYFYPDSPKNYQLTQQFRPICLGGEVEIELPGPARNIMGAHKKIPLNRIHLEEDVGKLNHHATDSLVDYNRAGTPLMELVTEPALHSADEAFAFLTALRALMQQGGVSDCDMEKGQMRCDVNVSIRPAGATALGTKVEMKNLNSIAYVRDAIAHEIRRQTALVQSGGQVAQETRDYDGLTGASQSLRSKEDAHDYRFFPDPDLMPVRVDETWKSSIAATLPERPFDRQRRLMEKYKLPYGKASVFTWNNELAEHYDECLKQAGNRAVSFAEKIADYVTNAATSKKTWTEFLREIERIEKENPSAKKLIPSESDDPNKPDLDFFLKEVATPPYLAEIANLTSNYGYLITSSNFPSLSAEYFVSSSNAVGKAKIPFIKKSADKLGLKPQPADTGELEQWCRDAIAANAKAAAEFRAGKESAINGLKGPVMKASRGKANPREVDATLRRLLAHSE